MGNDWIDYWNRSDSMQDKAWRRDAIWTAKQICKELNFNKETDVLLEIGCGHGFIIEKLSPHVKLAYGIDTSDINIDKAKNRFSDIKNLSFHTLSPNNYLDISKLQIKDVTHIICISVLQYYKSMQEVETLIRNLKDILPAGGGGKLLIADLLVDYNLIKDIFGVLIGSFFSGTLFSKLAEIIRGRHNLYTTIRAKNPLLKMSRKELEEICDRQNVSLKFLKRNFTSQWFRTSIIIEFSPKQNIV